MTKKKRIGIITLLYESTNYGGVLQAYALERYIAKLGYEVENIYYLKTERKKAERKGVKQYLRLVYNRTVINVITYLFLKKKIIFRKKAFSNFCENINHNNQVYTEDTIDKTNKLYDIFITGSDQVWHPSNFCDAYSLAFVDDSKIKFSYAASLSCEFLSEDLAAYYKKNLLKLDSISVREEESKDLLYKKLGISVRCCLDPTLLLSSFEWNEIATPKEEKKPYIFCYFLGNSIQIRLKLNKFAKLNKLPIIAIPFMMNKFQIGDLILKSKRKYDVTPNEFISLIRDAEYIFTDSFHATVFSCIFKKKFFVFSRDGMNSRIRTLLKDFGCFDRFVSISALKNYEFSQQPFKCNNLAGFEDKKKMSELFLYENINRF